MPSYRIVSQCSGGDHLQVEVTDDKGGKTVMSMSLARLTEIDPEAAKPTTSLRKLIEGKSETEVVAQLTTGIADIKEAPPEADVKSP